MTRPSAEYALKHLGADAHRALLHPNQHVRRVAWRMAGKPIPEDREARERLAEWLYPNHLRRFLRDGNVDDAPAALREILGL